MLDLDVHAHARGFGPVEHFDEPRHALAVTHIHPVELLAGQVFYPANILPLSHAFERAVVYHHRVAGCIEPDVQLHAVRTLLLRQPER